MDVRIFAMRAFAADSAVLLLMSAVFVCLGLGIFLSAVRDADPERAAQVLDLPTAPDAAVPVSVNYWPAVGAVSAACLVLGLAVGPALFVIGVIGL